MSYNSYQKGHQSYNITWYFGDYAVSEMWCHSPLTDYASKDLWAQNIAINLPYNRILILVHIKCCRGHILLQQTLQIVVYIWNHYGHKKRLMKLLNCCTIRENTFVTIYSPEIPLGSTLHSKSDNELWDHVFLGLLQSIQWLDWTCLNLFVTF